MIGFYRKENEMSDYKDLWKVIDAAMNDPCAGNVDHVTDAVWEALSDKAKGFRRSPVAMTTHECAGRVYIACDDGSLWQADAGGMKLVGQIPQGKLP